MADEKKVEVAEVAEVKKAEVAEKKVEKPVRTPDPAKNEVYLKGTSGVVVVDYSDELKEWISNPFDHNTGCLMWGATKYKYEGVVVKGKELDILTHKFFTKCKDEKRMPQWGKAENQEKIDSLVKEFIDTYGNGSIEGLKERLRLMRAENEAKAKAENNKPKKEEKKKDSGDGGSADVKEVAATSVEVADETEDLLETLSL